MEIEVKILGIDAEKIKKTLRYSLKAKHLFGPFKFQYYSFDHLELKLSESGKNLRLRRQWGERFGELTFKDVAMPDEVFKKREEINAIVEFENVKKILEEFGFYVHRYRENFREEWQYQDCKIEIDIYPKIPAYLEIEGKDEEKILRLASSLGYKEGDCKNFSVSEVLRFYGLSEEGQQSISHLVFGK
jgi:adenylate cyclase class 2